MGGRARASWNKEIPQCGCELNLCERDGDCPHDRMTKKQKNAKV